MATNNEQVYKISIDAESGMATLRDLKGQIVATQVPVKELRQEFGNFTKTVNATNFNKFNSELKKTNANMMAMKKGMQGASMASGSASASVMEMGRAISDSNYGIQGMANNLSQLASNLVYTTRAAGGLKAGMRDLWAAMMGPLGILIAIQSVIAIWEGYSMKARQVEEDNANLKVNIEGLVKTLDDLYVSQEGVNERVETYIGLAREKLALDILNKKKDEETSRLEKERISIKDNLNDAQGTLTLNQKAYSEQTDKTTTTAKGYAKAIKGLKIEIEGYNNALVKNEEDLEKVITKSVLALQDYNDKKNEASSSAERTVDVIKKEIKEEQRLQKVKSDTPEIWKSYTKKIKKLQEELEAITGKPVKAAKKTTEKTEQIFKDSVLNLEKYIRNVGKKTAKLGEENVMELLNIDHKYAKLDLAAKRTDFKNKENLRFEQWTQRQAKRLGLSVEEFKQEESYLIQFAELEKSFANADIQYKAALAALEIQQIIEINDKKIKLEEKHQERLVKATDADNVATGQSAVDNAVGAFKKIDAERELLALKEEQELAHVVRLIDIRKKEGEAYEDLQMKKNTINTKYTQANIALDLSERDARLATLTAISGAITSVGKLAGDNAQAQKAIGIASATIDTYVGANKAFAQGGVAGFATGAAVIAAGLANVMTIINTKVPNESGGSGNAPSFTPNFNVVGNSETNQLADSIGGQVNEPSRAYVVYEDIQEAGNLEANAIEASGI
jgi:hypothetical protein